MKKVLFIFSFLFVAVVLSACKSNGTSNKDYDLYIYQFKVEIQSDLENLVKQYEKEYNVKVKIETCGGGCDYGAELTTKMNKENKPAIFNIGGLTDVDTWQDYLVNVKGTTLYNKVTAPTLFGTVTKDDKVYGYPMTTEGYGLIYNGNLIQEYLVGKTITGVDTTSVDTIIADMSKSFDNAKAVVDYITANVASMNGVKAAFSTPGKETWVTGLHMANAATARAWDGGVSEAYSVKSISSSDAVYNRLIDLGKTYDLYKNNSTTSGADINTTDYNTQVKEDFATGKVFFIQQGNWAFGDINGVDSDLASHIGFIPIPYDNSALTGAAKEADYDKLFVGVPMFWAINSQVSAAEQREAQHFLDYMYISHLNDVVVKKFGFIAPYEGAQAPADPLGAAISEYVNAGKVHAWTFNGYPADWGMQVLGSEIQKYTDGTNTSWKETIDNAVAEWSR